MNHTKRNKITQMQRKLLFNGPNLNISVNDFDVEKSARCKKLPVLNEFTLSRPKEHNVAVNASDIRKEYKNTK